MGLPTATVRMTGPDAVVRVATACGSGPVDAAFKAIDSLVRVDVQLTDYIVKGVTEGIEALANTRVVIQPVGTDAVICSPQGRKFQRTFSATGADSDIVVASARAYTNALNRLIGFLSARKRAEQESSSSEPLTAVASS